jgi:methenyltetrahydromethanopterin cyclohydrolase
VTIELNASAVTLCRGLVRDAERFRVAAQTRPGHPQLIDCGIDVKGGIEAGRRLAEISLAGLGRVELIPAEIAAWSGQAVMVTTDHPVAACLASQYAGWKVAHDDYFGMLSGPIRAAAGREALFDTIGHRETAAAVVGVIESDRMPPPGVVDELAAKCHLPADRLTLLVAPITSQAGTIQVVARSVETTLHKLHQLGFDLDRIESGVGIAPLPPVAADQITGIGRSNDAIIYGGQVTLYVRGDDRSIVETGPNVPSTSSSDFGETFAEVFRRYDQDFYRIDPQLFSPAVVTWINLDSGGTFRFGRLAPDVIQRSFGLGESR